MYKNIPQENQIEIKYDNKSKIIDDNKDTRNFILYLGLTNPLILQEVVFDLD